MLTAKYRKDAILKASGIFPLLSHKDLEVISGYSDLMEFSKGQKIFSEGEPGNTFYIVEKGEVVVQKNDDSGNTTDIARFVEGDCFGELDLFKGVERNADSVAASDSVLLAFPGKDNSFESFQEKFPEAAAGMLHSILVLVAGRIRRVNAMVKANSPLVQELRNQVYRDKQTGLYNQIYLTEKIAGLIKKSNCFALLISKPDNFKALNDAYGHSAGDAAIRIMGLGLRDFTGDEEYIARYKGNAMAVVLPLAGRSEALETGNRISGFMKKLDVREATEGNPFSVTASTGIVLYPDHGNSPEELISLAHELPLAGRLAGGDKVLFPEDREEL